MSYVAGQHQPPVRQRRRSGLQIRLAIAAAILLFSLVSYMASTQVNPITGEKQRVGLSPDQEVAIGLQALPEMVQQHGGFSRDERATRTVKQMGARLVNALDQQLRAEGKQLPWQFDFHLLADDRTINAFALPGGQVFITEALYYKLTDPGQLAGILGHEIGHVLERHSAQRVATGRLIQGVSGAAGVAGGDANSARMAAMVGNLVSMKYGRDDELESDRWGVTIMALAGYDPNHMMEVMDILEQATGGAGPPEMLSTHPKPANRRAYLQEVIREQFPNGLPPGLR